VRDVVYARAATYAASLADLAIATLLIKRQSRQSQSLKLQHAANLFF
jgi:hypothetical protein